MDAIRAFGRTIRESLFLVPLVIIVLCGGLAFVTVYLDRDLGSEITRFPLLVWSTVSGARTTVTAVAGATITVAAIVFSITSLSTQIAASQYSPRAVKGFFEDRFQQFVIGFTIGTFTFCLFVLAGLGTLETQVGGQIASLSVTLSILMGVFSVIAIVAYIDHSLRRMHIDSVIRGIAEQTLDTIRRDQRHSDMRKNEPRGGMPEGESHSVSAKRSGFVLEIDAERIAGILPPEANARVEVRRGEAVSAGDRLITVWADVGLSDELTRQIRSAMTMRRDRSISADPYFGLRLLVDIALKALSPGINDPTTAVDVLHQLKLPLRELLTRDQPNRVRVGPDQQRVFLAADPSMSDVIHASFAEIRIAGSEQVSVISTLLEVLGDLIIELEDAGMEARTGALKKEAALAIAAMEGSGLPQEDIERALVSAKRLQERD
ncbi:MAG: DUF2254 domain-containing protein [Acidimicrobiia bacterium]